MQDGDTRLQLRITIMYYSKVVYALSTDTVLMTTLSDLQGHFTCYCVF